MKTSPLNILDFPDCYAEPGKTEVIDMVNPNTGLGAYSNQTLEQVRVDNPTAERVSYADHARATAARQDAPGEWIEETETNYEWMLNVLPPAAMLTGAFLVGEPQDHHALTGAPRYDAHKAEYGKGDRRDRFFVYTRPMTVKQFRAIFGGAK